MDEYLYFLIGLAGLLVGFALGVLFQSRPGHNRMRGGSHGPVHSNQRTGNTFSRHATESRVASLNSIHRGLCDLEAFVGLSQPPILNASDDIALTQIQQRLQKIRNALDNGRPAARVPRQEQQYEPTRGSSYSDAPPLAQRAEARLNGPREEFVGVFNEAIGDRAARNRFWDHYDVTQIGNRNASEQRMGRKAEPDFRTSSPGDFIAVPEGSTGNFLVAPNFSTIIDENSYKHGGIASAFETNMVPDGSFQRFHLVEPAVFSRMGDRWEVLYPGRLTITS